MLDKLAWPAGLNPTPAFGPIAGVAPYLYAFDYAPAGAPFGACHTIELPFVFGGEGWHNAPMLGHAKR